MSTEKAELPEQTQEELNENLFRSVLINTEEGNKKVAELIRQGVNVNAIDDESGWTPLHAACFMSHNKKNVELLINAGADINARDQLGATPIFNACKSKETEDVVELLLKEGAEINIFDKRRYRDNVTDQNYFIYCSPLYIASSYQQQSIVTLLINNGADINLKTGYDKRTWLHVACIYGDTKAVKLLLEKGVDVNTFDTYKQTPLHAACANGNPELVTLLLEKGVNVNTSDTCQQTPLHVACVNEHTEIVKLLLEKGVDVNTSDTYKQTPLHAACAIGNPEIVTLLLEKNANVHAVDKNKRTPLHIACVSGGKDVVNLFDDLTLSSENALTQLCAKEEERSKIVKLLLEKNANVHAVDKDNKTPLHAACVNAYTETVKLLLDKDANVNAQDNEGKTPLHTTLDNQFKNEKNLDIQVKNNSPFYNLQDIKKNSLSAYESEKRQKTVRVLLYVPDIDINIQDNEGKTVYTGYPPGIAKEFDDYKSRHNKIKRAIKVAAVVSVAVPIVSYFALGLLGASVITTAAVLLTQAFGGILGGILGAAKADFRNEQSPSNKGSNPNRTVVGKYTPSITKIPSTNNTTQNNPSLLGKGATTAMVNSVDKTLKLSKNNISDSSTSSNSNNDVDDHGSSTWQNNNSNYNSFQNS